MEGQGSVFVQLPQDNFGGSFKDPSRGSAARRIHAKINPTKPPKGDRERKTVTLWWEKQKRKLWSCGARESRGCERQMGEAGTSAFSSCLLAHTLTTRLRPLRLPHFAVPSLSFRFIFEHPLSRRTSLHTLIFSCWLPTHCTTVSNELVKTTSASGCWSHPPPPPFDSWLLPSRTLSRCVTHKTNALNESVRIWTILAAFAPCTRVGELWVPCCFILARHIWMLNRKISCSWRILCCSFPPSTWNPVIFT